MQGCFRQYPEIYGAELGDEEDVEGEGQGEAAAASPAANADAPVTQDATSEPASAELQGLREQTPGAAPSNKPETNNLPGAAPANGKVPTKWEDATAANDHPDGEGEEKKDEKK